MDDSNKKALVGLAAAVVIGAAATGIVWGVNSSQNNVATVNGTTIEKVEYDKIFDQTKKQYASRFGIDFASDQGKQVEKDIKKGIIDQLVDRQLILNEAAARNVQVTDAQIEEKLAEIKKGFPDDAAFTKTLEDNGMKLTDLQTRIKEGLTVEAVTAAVTSELAVTDEEVKKYYDDNLQLFKKPEEVNARHILIKDEKKAKDVLTQLKGGGDFAALAKEHSEDPGSGAQGGDLGFYGRGRMVPEFEKTAFTLKKDELSGLVKSQFGYHILKGGEHNGARTQPFDEVKPEIKERLLKERQQAEFGKWLAAQKEKAKVEYKTGYDPKAVEAAPAEGQPAAPAEGQPAAPAGDDGHGHSHGEGDDHGHEH